ncbi:39S ribosomal protein L9, mitochondrial [Coccinella septempunctata]|uniref:39S ribosomal protein L9, mitochondrial n=1 Tax=Coccinella septempunctata TaxID=41139 RepID=UPI001D08273F|nr:39S ribosomal protein L9, mitochondrial [Coccinella septempunctata]
MWPSVRSLMPQCQTLHSILNQQVRTTYILKRKFPVQLHKKNMPPKTLRSRHYVYELVKDTTIEKQPQLKLILTAHVEGLGSKGDIVEVKPSYGYNTLILLQKAVYASEENISKYASLKDDVEDKPSSPLVPMCMQSLAKMTLSVVMNMESPWEIKPWHIKVSFRKCGWEVPEKAIVLPEMPIKGPNMNIEGKEFYITVVFSPKEKQEVKCRLHHWSTDPSDRLPYVKEFWKIPVESVFADLEKYEQNQLK